MVEQLVLVEVLAGPVVVLQELLVLVVLAVPVPAMGFREVKVMLKELLVV